MTKVTMGMLMELWEEAFKAGHTARSDTPWIDVDEAFKIWWESQEEKLNK